MQGCLKQLSNGFCLILATVAPSDGSGVPETVWDTHALFESEPAVEASGDYLVNGLESFFYSSLDWNGEPTRVYAYLGMPSGQPPEAGWPAVVLVHGGGGTAFSEWVQRWNQRGFAAIAMDLEGRLPDRTVPFDQRPGFDGSGPARVGVWGDADLPPEEQWFYHAVAQVILANNVLRNRSDIDASAIGVMGVSWGGIITSVVAGVDPRFRFAIPVYGCGFLNGADGPIGNSLSRYSSQRLERIQQWWEPSNYLPHAAMPMLFINGTNDSHFPLDIWQKSADAVPGGAWQSAQRGLTHGHVPPQLLEEPYYFVSTVLEEGSGVPRISSPALHDSTVTAKISSGAPDGLAIGRLAFTVDSGSFLTRQWQVKDAEINGDQLSADLPMDSTAWFFELELVGNVLLTSPYSEPISP
jgi:dienelactone hydrolase